MLPQKIVDSFMLNSVIMASDHVLNQAQNDASVEFVESMFQRGLLGQLKLREDYVGGQDDKEYIKKEYDFWI